MSFANRHRLSILVVSCALLAAAGVFTFARPAYHREYASPMIDFSQQRYYAPAAVRAAFAAHGVRLRYGSHAAPLRMFSNEPSFRAETLQVVVGPRTGTGSFGPVLEPYDERFGNVLVTYGGDDERLLGRVESAVDDLR